MFCFDGESDSEKSEENDSDGVNEVAVAMGVKGDEMIVQVGGTAVLRAVRAVQLQLQVL
jgi:hypothetical protein